MTAEKVLAVARGELGNTESPAGSNRTKYGKWFGLDGYAWCMMFVMWCFSQAGALELLPKRTASCGDLMRSAKAAGRWVTEDYRPGDVVIYDFPGGAATDHTGIIESVTASGVVAIEGNTSQAGSQSNGGQVCRKDRKYNMIVGAVRPRFEEEEDMKIEDLTDAQVLQLGKRIQAVMGRQPVSPALAAELQEAKAKGITDGNNPGAFCTRAQAAVMTLRATKK
ncbi:CHAP domain-containing protein [uncultured Oscillibacter sp.]|uniref:CHAP domain-containing protein n=1 Tax=uncultured Oscillibacter sp. TaxID=876091 RepID=UPI00260686B7|nr:CHAP domain-containing protein [uncultured Oscillibacter sp.]